MRERGRTAGLERRPRVVVRSIPPLGADQGKKKGLVTRMQPGAATETVLARNLLRTIQTTQVRGCGRAWPLWAWPHGHTHRDHSRRTALPLRCSHESQKASPGIPQYLNLQYSAQVSGCDAYLRRQPLAAPGPVRLDSPALSPVCIVWLRRATMVHPRESVARPDCLTWGRDTHGRLRNLLEKRGGHWTSAV